MAKQCSTCREYKPEEDFYRDKRRPDGLKSQCRRCHTLTSISTRDVDLHRDANRNWMRKSKYGTRADVRERNMLRRRVKGKSMEVRARALANRAVELGFLVRPTVCPVCNRSEFTVHAHHDDYAKPLQVRWMCSECHGKEHRNV